MSVLDKREYPSWYLETLGLNDVSESNLFLQWIYSLYFNRVVLPKFPDAAELSNRKFTAMWTEVLLHDKKNSTRRVYLVMFYARTPTTSYVFWNVSPTIWPFDTEHDWTFKKRKHDCEIFSIISDVVRYARFSTDSVFFNRLKYVQRKSKRLPLWPMRFLKACNSLF